MRGRDETISVYVWCRQCGGQRHVDGPDHQETQGLRLRHLQLRGECGPGVQPPLPQHQQQEGGVQEGPTQGGRHVRQHGCPAGQEAGDDSSRRGSRGQPPPPPAASTTASSAASTAISAGSRATR